MKKYIYLLLVFTLIITSIVVVVSGVEAINNNNNTKSTEIEGTVEKEIELVEKIEEKKPEEEVVLDEEIEVIDEVENENENSQTEEEKLIRYDRKNNIDMGVIFTNPIEDDIDYLVFNIRINNHTLNLEEIKYSELATISIGDGPEIKDGFTWESKSQGHHISGKLKLPKSLLGTKTNLEELESIQLDFKDIGGPDTMTFRWDKEILKQNIENNN